MRINEIFYSIQGEGARVGEPSIFIRLAGCDQTCGFCDTEFESGKEMDLSEIHGQIAHWPCRWIVWTGGEPLLQLTEEIIHDWNRLGYSQAVETNGNHKAPPGLAWVVVSPKVAEHVLLQNFPKGVDELRYVRHAGQYAVPLPKIQATYRYLSPMFDGNRPNKENVQACLRLVKENPQWRLSLQLHKLIGVL